MVIFISGSACIFNYVSEMESESLVSNKIPNINGTSSVVRGSVVVGGFGHFSIRFFIQFDKTNACSCKATITVAMSSFFVSGLASCNSSWRSFKSCSMVNSVIGFGGPEYGFFFLMVVIGSSKYASKLCIN